MPALLMLCLPFQGGAWTLDHEQSQISYLSYKLVDKSYQSIVENNFFERFAGSVSEDGVVQLTIDADSVNTGVEIRDERVRLHAFDSENHPQIVFNARLEQNLDALKPGEVKEQELSGTLTMRGVTRPITARLVVVRNTTDTALVKTLSPIIINAADYGMEEGFEQLRALVNLFNIPQFIPVSVKLVMAK